MYWEISIIVNSNKATCFDLYWVIVRLYIQRWKDGLFNCYYKSIYSIYWSERRALEMY
jgi:hypothetical protein